jgi:cobalt-zinc-cadmium efflux system protein
VTAHDHVHDHRAAGERALLVVLGLTAGFTVVEVVAGLLTDSLALLADAGHMLSDVLAVGLALVAMRLARRPATLERSFGWRRAEILAAFVNGIALVGIAVWIAIAAVQRLDTNPEILGGWMLAVAVAGLAVNLAAAAVLVRSGRQTLNVEAAFRHVLADVLGSVGVIVAALIILLTGWVEADAVVSLVIAALICWSAWGIVSESTHVLLEAAPSGLDMAEVETALGEAPGVVDVHDLHVWTITSGFVSLSAHVLVARGDDCHARRLELERLISERFGIEHTTLQVDHALPELLTIDPAQRPAREG